MNKKEIGLIASYNYAARNPKHIRDCYINPSSAKIAAEERILREMVDCNGRGYTVCGHNCNLFSAGYTFHKDGKTYLCYHTHANTYIVEKPF